MKRKIVRQGTSTYMISLPKKWIDKNEVRKGQDLNVEAEGDMLKISINKIDMPSKKTELFVDNTTTSLIYRAYRLGYVELDINLKTKDDSKEVKIIVNNLIGADIIEIENKKLKVVFSNPEIKIDQDYYFQKILRLLIWEFKFLINNFTKDVSEEDLELIRLEIIRRIEFLIRDAYLNQSVGEKFLLMINLLDPLKKMQEEILSHYREGKKKKISFKEKEYFISILKIIENIYSYIKSGEEISKIYSLNQTFSKRSNEFLNKTKEFNTSSSLAQIITMFIEDFMNSLIPYISLKKQKQNLI